jgi:protein involved in polysaccharide export with SLBB domain
MPFDVINIRQQPGFTYKRTVFVEGMVKKPGRYTLQMSNERLSDIIDRCEGFRANADSSALVIRRLSKKVEKFEDRQKIFTKLLNIKSDSLNQSESIRNEIYKDYDKISIDLNKALKNRDQSENMILEDGDVISIERNTNLVKISGEVYFPTIVPFKNGANLRYYIRKSGSFTQVARKNGTLVIYPDGKAKKVKHFLFIRNYPKVVSRSEIFVPQKTSINRNKVSVSEWAVILSSLGIIANVILNFKK